MTDLMRYLLLLILNFLQASSSTSTRYVPGVTLTVARRRSVDITTTWEDIVRDQLIISVLGKKCSKFDDIGETDTWWGCTVISMPIALAMVTNTSGDDEMLLQYKKTTIG